MKKKYTEKEVQERIQKALEEKDKEIKLEQRFDYIMRDYRDTQESNYRRFQDLDSALYKLTERIEKLESKKEKQHKVLHG